MRLLLDQNVSPFLTEALSSSGHDAVHVRSFGLSKVSDEAIMEAAIGDDRIRLRRLPLRPIGHFKRSVTLAAVTVAELVNSASP